MHDFFDFDECPRCGFAALERLSTHTYCAECNYSPDLDDYKEERPWWLPTAAISEMQALYGNQNDCDPPWWESKDQAA